MVKMISISFDRIGTVAVRQGFSLRLTLFIVFVSLFSEIRTQTSLPGNPILSIIDAKNEGDTVTLTCTSYGGNPLPTVRWYKNTQLVDPGSSPNGNGDGVFTVGSTTATYNNYTFQVSRSDNAVSYICKVNSSLLTSELTRSLRIEVYVPADNPIISGPTAATALDANKNYNHTCTAANGYPVVNIVWRLGTSFGTSQDLSQGVSGRTFRISESTTTNSDSTLTKVSVLSWTPITADNGNILFCVTTQLTAPGGSVPNITKSTNVLISVQQIPILQILNTSYTIEVGQAVTLGCRIVSALPPATRVSWSRFVNGVYNRVAIDNVRYFGSTVSNPNLTITNVALSDATTYQCSATNNAGTGNSGMTLLTVTGNLPQVRIAQSQYSVLYGGSVYMECTVENAVPPVTAVRWYKGTSVNHFNLSIDVRASKYSGGVLDNPSLNITNVVPSDEGFYSCNATNLVGTASAWTFFDVYGDIPSITLRNTSYSVMVGDPVTLACDYNSSPAPTAITWQRIQNAQSTNINVLDSRFGGGTIVTPYLTIRTTLLSDAGVYTCSVTNQVGTTTGNPIFLFINGSTPSVSIPQSTYNVSFGDPITIPCNVTAVPTATNVSWVKTSNGVSVTLDPATQPSKYSGSTVLNPSLTISNTNLTDEGNYVCSASNTVGTGSSNAAFLDVIGDVPAVSVSQTSYSIFVGSSVTLNCFVSGNPAVSFVFWTVTRNGFTQNAQDSRYSNGDINNPSLTINNARQSDTGVFVCKAQNSAGTTDSSPISLTVSGTSPNVTMAQSSYSVLTNGDVTLSCFVSANPSASISWTFTSNSGGVTAISASTSKYSLATSTTSSSLTVRSANSNDQGSYRCSATNSVGTGQATATLVVSGSLPSINLPSTYSVITGNDITMTCTVSANPAVNSVFWQFRAANGFSFTNITATFKYSISSLTGTSSLTVRSTTSSDNGQYRCQATNQVGTSQSTTVLTVSGSVPVVNIPQNSYSSVTGQDVQIPCSVSANPSATITWTFISTSQSQTSITTSTSKYTFNSSSTDGTLRIRSTSSSDTGTYRCQATNAVGTSSDSASLSVSGSPPSVNFGSSSYSVTTGQSIQLVCFVSASPTATDIAWTFQSNTGGGTTTITSSTSGYSLTTTTSYTQSTLTVLSAQSSNGGTYTCRATNLVGTRSASASLSVSGNIPTVTIPQNSYSVVTGQDVQIPCSVSASPSASISWIFISTSQSQITISSSTFKYTFNPTSTDGTLTVRSTTSSDTGTYHCQATNAVGTASDSASLSVSGSLPSVTITQTTYSVITGSNQQIPCFVSANPTASAIGWTFRSATSGTTVTITSSTSGYSIVTSSTSQSTLTVLAADNNDEGTYTCQATNQVGNGSDSAFLDVTSIPVVTLPTTLYERTYGQNVTMQCSVTATPDITEVRWQRFVNGAYQDIFTQSSTKYYGSSITNFALTVTNLVFTDAGDYRCTATNQVGRGVSPNRATLSVLGDAATVTVSPPSQSVLQKSTAIIQCFINNANPGVTEVLWEKISSGTSSSVIVTGRFNGSTPSLPDLIISDLQPSDAGTYYCSARNAIGTSRSSTGSNLIVTGAVPNNVQILGATSQTVNLGGSLTLQCSGQGNPAPTLSWIFSSSTSDATTVGTGTTYSITDAQRTNGGTYVCRGTNSLGSTDSQGVTVDVLYAPIDARTDTQKSLSVAVGSTVSLVCAVDANPVASYEWYRSNQLVSNQREYTFALSSLALLGSYTCKATNSRGSVELRYTLSEDTGSENAVIIATSVILPVIFFVLLALALMIFLRRKRRNSSQNTSKQMYIPSVDKLVQESAKENREILNVCHSKKDSIYDTIEDEEGYLKSFPVRKICNLPYTKSPTSLVPSKEEDENISNAYLYILE